MYRVRIDYNDSLDMYEFKEGSEFYFDEFIEATDFIETCFESNKDRKVVEIKYIKDE